MGRARGGPEQLAAASRRSGGDDAGLAKKAAAMTAEFERLTQRSRERAKALQEGTVDPCEVDLHVSRNGPSYVARIDGLNAANYDLQLGFEVPLGEPNWARDGKTGSLTTVLDGPGLYEVQYWTTAERSKRGYFRLSADGIKELELEDVEALLRDESPEEVAG